ncbi:MAG: peptide deformylase [Candidatus Beckwithbacteria bacterium]|nr:peptide deformylase [Candidatus Beckwithbacteria bacterium]
MILNYPNPILRQTAKPVKTINEEIRELAKNLLATVIPDPREPLGVGLAANQIGSLWRVFVMMFPTKKIEVIINPQILKSSKKMLSSLPKNDQFLEGCLSFPGYYGFVDRPVKIKVSYQTLSSLTKTVRLTAPYSIYFQHELDHLNGILFIDYIKKSDEQLYFGSGRDHLKPVKNPF